jgi:hypothetical protein
MSEKRHRRVAATLALTTALCLPMTASALPFGSSTRDAGAGWSLDSIVAWFQTVFMARWTHDGATPSGSSGAEKLGSVGGTGGGGTGGTGGSSGSGGSGATLVPDGSPQPGNP